jgi:hypothetical protein
MILKKYLLIAGLVLPLMQAADAQTITGKVCDASNRSVLIGAHLTLTVKSDSTRKQYAGTNVDGLFSFENIIRGSYLLKASFLGYQDFTKPVTVTGSAYDCGTIYLTQKIIQMSDYVVTGAVPLVDQVGDTVQFNSKAYKLNADASAEDLVTKLPGVTVENNTVKSQGEEIKQVFVDGKRFFGDDPTIALRNLPAEVIDKIQVYDKLSDQAELTGFDDGQSTKTMNIITRQDRRQGQFGRATAAYGQEQRYQVGGALNLFNAGQRITFIGQSNNINQQNFAQQDFLGVLGGGGSMGGGGGGGRGGGGSSMGGGGRGQMSVRATSSGPGSNFFTPQQNGVTATHAIGGQYTDAWASNLNVEGSYFFNRTENHQENQTTRQYFVVNDTNAYYNENGTSDRNNTNHRFNLRMEYAVDSTNMIIFAPRVSVQLNNSTSSTIGQNAILQNVIQNQSLRNSGTDVTGYTSSNSLIYRHKYELPGRSISFQMNVNANDRQSDGSSQSWNTYHHRTATGDSITGDDLDQKLNSTVNGYSVSGTATYTEPLSVNTLFQINYSPSYSEQASDKRSNDYDTLTNAYDHFNPLFSNTLKTYYTTNSGGVGLQYRDGEINSLLGVNYQQSAFTANRTYPNSLRTEKSFDNVLPAATLHWRFDKSRGLQFLYRTSTNPPSVTQLENSVDNTNPLMLSTGNPDLKQYYTHSLTARYNNTNVTSLQSIFLLVSGTYTLDYIGNATYFATRDSTLPGGAVWNQGAQLTKPMNLGDQQSIRFMATYGTPIDLISSNMYLNLGYTIGVTPSIVSGLSNTISANTISPGISLNSNISQDFDCMLGYNANFNKVRNTTQANYDYFSHTASGKLQWIFWQGFTFRTDVKEQLNSNGAANIRQEFVLWNLSIGKKLFSNDRGEIMLQVFDVLNQNKNVTQSVEDTYVEEVRTNNLNRYFLLTFTYRLSGFQEPPPRPPGGGRSMF